MTLHQLPACANAAFKSAMDLDAVKVKSVLQVGIPIKQVGRTSPEFAAISPAANRDINVLT